jgi:acyl carrier protein
MNTHTAPVSREELTRRLIQMAAEQVSMDPAQVGPASHFYDDLSFDSLDIVEYAINIEEEYEVSVPDEQMEQIKTVCQAIDAVAAALARKAADS